MGKGKLQKFDDNLIFGNVLQPEFPEISPSYYLKGKWASEHFKNNNPIILELACGKGDYAVALAEHNPDVNFIGMDIKGARIWRGAKTAYDKGLKNIVFFRQQIDQITNCFDKEEISGIWITFPDPHPRKSRSRRRLTSPNFLNKFRKILTKDAIIHLKTDNQELFEYTLEIIEEYRHTLLFQTRDVYNTEVPHEVSSIKTFYEKMFLSIGMPIFYLKFQLKKE